MNSFKNFMAKIGLSKSEEDEAKISQSLAAESAVLLPQPISSLKPLTKESTELSLPALLSTRESLSEPLPVESLPVESPSIKTSALKSSAFRHVPKEVFLEIIDLLPPSSAALLSLSCRPIYNLLGTQYITALKEPQIIRNSCLYNFLALLERDLPNHIACYSCNKLHSIEKSVPGDLDKSWFGDRCANNHLCIGNHWYFEFNNFRRGMKLYHQGCDLSSLIVVFRDSRTSINRKNQLPKQKRLVVRIVESTGSLVSREQTIYLIPQKSLSRCKSSYISLPNYICQHFATDCKYYFRRRSLVLTDYDGGTFDWKKIVWSTFTRCTYCMTEFRVNIMDLGEDGEAVLLTKWQDLGRAQSPLEENWVKAFKKLDNRFHNDRPIEYEEGSICTAFEGEHYTKSEIEGDLTDKDWDELISKRFSHICRMLSK
ncbi:hypothetical protein NHQ30_005968 [Ciborinia camelliae]|nr:hypothetical protein NHQ30_005968 [Ciborinia camelliae]